MIKGIDYLGLAHKLFPIEAVRDLTPKGYAIGCFDHTFGDVIPKLHILLASNKFPVYRIQIGWDDNQNANDHQIIPPDLLRRRAAVYQILALEFPSIKFYLSHSCEHDCHDQTQVQKRIEILKRFAPKCIPINCPGTGASLPRGINEYHDANHAHREPYFASMDGCGLGASGAWTIGGREWKALHRRAGIAFWWVPEINGRKGAAPAPPPLQRTKFITPAEIKEVISYTL